MKIGMLVDTYLPILGGAEVHVLELSRALRAQGDEVAVCTAVPGEKPASANPVSGNWVFGSAKPTQTSKFLI